KARRRRFFIHRFRRLTQIYRNADLLVMGVASRCCAARHAAGDFFLTRRREGAKEKIFYPQIPQINADLLVMGVASRCCAARCDAGNIFSYTQSRRRHELKGHLVYGPAFYREFMDESGVLFFLGAGGHLFDLRA
ncbi:MAG TPA: hypothetical protein PLE35_00910, partial [Lentisphaeria bacterium]|nr:hypothetical protein [Lentisphaeria bacterium]